MGDPKKSASLVDFWTSWFFFTFLQWRRRKRISMRRQKENMKMLQFLPRWRGRSTRGTSLIPWLRVCFACWLGSLDFSGSDYPKRNSPCQYLYGCPSQSVTAWSSVQTSLSTKQNKPFTHCPNLHTTRSSLLSSSGIHGLPYHDSVTLSLFLYLPSCSTCFSALIFALPSFLFIMDFMSLMNAKDRALW